MINMVKAELYRIFRGVGIYIAIAAMLLLIGLSIYSVGAGSIGVHIDTTQSVDSPLNDMSYDEIQVMSTSEYRKAMLKSEGFELDRDILSCNMNMYYVFIFVVALAVAVDFSAGSVKNTLSSAISRKRYYLSKLIFITFCCLLFLHL